MNRLLLIFLLLSNLCYAQGSKAFFFAQSQARAGASPPTFDQTNEFADFDGTLGVTSSGGDVTVWADQFSNHDARWTTGTKPTISGGAMTFTAAGGDFLTLDNTASVAQPFEAFLVMKSNVTGGGGFLLHIASALSFYGATYTGGNVTTEAVTTITCSSTITANTYYVLSHRFDNAASRVRVNSTETTGTITTSGALSNITIGQSFNSVFGAGSFTVKRILLFQGGPISDATRDDVIAYLNYYYP